MRKNSESFGKYPHKICRPIRKSGYLCRGAEAPFHKLTDMYRILTAALFDADRRLGYSHDSTMTYGDQWTVLCAEVFVEMGAAGRLPVGSKTIIDNLPM